MQKKILILFGVFCLVGALAQATVVNGSVPNKGSKLYTFTPDFSGIVLLSLIYESNAADLDLRLAAPDNSGQLQVVAFSESTLKRQEELQIGVQGGIQYTIIVFSFSGSSAFRLSFEGTFTTSSPGQAGASSGGVELREVQPNAAMVKFLEKLNKQSDAMKHR